MGKSITLEIDNVQAYKIVIVWKIYLFGSTMDSVDNFTYYIEFNNLLHTKKIYFTCENIINNQNCSNICISKNNLILENNLLQDNNLTFVPMSGSSNNSEIKIGIS